MGHISRRTLLSGAAAVALAGGSRAAVAPTVPVPPPVGLAKFSNTQTRMPFWGAHGVATAGFTLGSVWTAESEFDWVRLIYPNTDTATHQIDAASIAPSSMLADFANPRDQFGQQVTTGWKPATFNSGGALGDFPPLTGSQRSVVMAAATQGITSQFPVSDRIATYAYSDLIPCQSIARQDAGATLPLLFVRTYSAAGIDCMVINDVLSMAPGGGQAWDAFASGRIIRTTGTSGDSATTPGIVGANIVNALAPGGVQFISRHRSMTILVPGDSEYQGFGTTSHQNDPFQMAAFALSTPSFPVIVAKLAYQGMGSAAFDANGRNMALGIKPTAMLVKAGTPNDIVGATVNAAYEAALAAAFAQCNWCDDHGIIPILTTYEPFALGPAADLVRVSVNAAVRASGRLYIDMDLALSDGGTPANVKAQFLSSSVPPHWNDAGAAAVMPLAMAVFQRILATRPQ